MNKNIFLFNFSNSDFISDQCKVNMKKYLKSNKFNVLDLDKIKSFIIDNYLIKIKNIKYDLKFDLFNDNIKVTLIKNAYIEKTDVEKTNVEKTDVKKINVEKTDVEKTNVEKTDVEKDKLRKKLKNKIKNIQNKRTQNIDIDRKNIPKNIPKKSKNMINSLKDGISNLNLNEGKQNDIMNKMLSELGNGNIAKMTEDFINNAKDVHKQRRIEILYNILKKDDVNIPKKEEILSDKDVYVNKIFENILSLSIKCQTKEELHKKMNTHYMNYLQEVCEMNYKDYLDEFLRKIKNHVHVEPPKIIKDIKDNIINENELDEAILNKLQDSDSDSDKEIEINENI